MAFFMELATLKAALEQRACENCGAQKVNLILTNITGQLKCQCACGLEFIIKSERSIFNRGTFATSSPIIRISFNPQQSAPF